MFREYVAIIQRNVITPIVIAMAVLIATLLLLGESRDAFFISIVISLNVIVAVVQEIRVHHALRKLEILNAPRAHRRTKTGEYEIVPLEVIAVGDILKIGAGDQVPADGKVLSSRGLECDESLLTGEARTITKAEKTIVYAGSTVMAGSATMKVTAAHEDTRAGKMTATLKQYKPELTPLQKTISRAIQALTYGAIAITILITVVYSARQVGLITIVRTITTAGIVLVPEGLLLASTLLLAFGALNLARNKVLPQKLSAIEAMALLEVLCVDKTGTLTSDVIEFERIIPLHGVSQEHVESALAVISKEAASGNGTSDAILRALSMPEKYGVTDILAFSSDRKMSAVRMKDGSAFMMGAPEVIAKYAAVGDEQMNQVQGFIDEGLRVLMVASLPQSAQKLHDLKPEKQGEAIGIVLLSNRLREGVKATVSFLQKRDVSIRVISGDNPRTVQYVAEAAGIRHADKAITGAELEKLTDEQWDEAVLETTIFARVLPEHKKKIIATLKEHGNFTGMVGDGVNDALALKEADLSVAMFAGAAASRRVADIILLNNSFTSLPIGMKLGNKIMQAIELIASLFFHKIIYGLVLLMVTLGLGVLYPFSPRHITFMNIFLVTLPTILWTFFPPDAPKRIDPRLFWKRTLGRIAPVAVLSGACVAFVYWWLLSTTPSVAENSVAISTTTVLAASLFGIVAVFIVPRMLRVPMTVRTIHMRSLYVIGVVIVMMAAFAIPTLRDFFNFTAPATTELWLPLMLVAAVISAQYYIVDRLVKKAV